MTKTFKAVKPQLIKINPFSAIGAEWMLITAGNLKSFNMMTASWGGLGVLWHKNICFCVVRPHRYTYGFMERSDKFTLSFFDKRHKDVLNLCGTKSGRDVDKAAVTGLTPLGDETGAVYFKQACLVFVCRKIYFQQIDPRNFLDPKIDENYPQKDYHRMYVGEVVKALEKTR